MARDKARKNGADTAPSDTSSSKAREEEERKQQRKRDLCLPPAGKTYLTIGQDLYSIQEYMQQQQNSSLHWYMKRQEHHDRDDTSQYKFPLPVPSPDDVVPAAVMVYTDLQTLRGLDRPVDYGTGIEYATGALKMASPPNNPLGVGLQVGLWLNGTSGCQDIVKGKLDAEIKELVYYLGVKCPASKIFLRIGYEFDNPEFGYASNPKLYRDAFNYIARSCRKHTACHLRTEMVWHSWAAGLPTAMTLEDFYPGDDTVDWIGVSIFQQFYNQAGNGGTPQDIRNVLGFAATHEKPTMIAESTPFGGIHNNPHVANNNVNNIWEAWFEPTLRLIEQYDIGMWSYINCNWEAQPFWKGVGFGDTRLSVDSHVMLQWHDQVMSSRRFIRATDYALCGNYPNDYYNDVDFDYVYEYDYDHHFSSKSMTYDDDDGRYRSSNRRGGRGNSRQQHRSPPRHDYPYRYDYNRDDDDSPQWIWGNERSNERTGVWNAVLPIVMLSSSLAIVFFMYSASRRSYRRRLERTPRAQRVRFSLLDDKLDPDDGSFALYGSLDTCCSVASEDKDSSRWKRSVRRVGPQLIVANTGDGSTIVA